MSLVMTLKNIQRFVKKVSLPCFSTLGRDIGILQCADEPNQVIVNVTITGSILTKTYEEAL